MSAADELDPTEFVQRIRQLGEQRDQQDAERVRKLEEEIIQGRSERLARRAERARSLSPEKTNTPQSQRSAAGTPRSIHEKAAESPTPVMEPPSDRSSREDSLRALTGSPAAPLDEEPKKPSTSSVGMPTRSGTLSWQQRRPQSGARRPLSMVAAEKSATQSPRETPEPTSPEDSGINRDKIAQSLGSKDPAWFRQTADRGVGSAAYRRSQEDSASDVGSISGRRQLPGLSRESTAEPEASSPPPESFRSSSPSRGSSVRGSAAWSNRFSANTSVSGGDGDLMGKKSPLPTLDTQKFSMPPPDQPPVRDSGEQSGLGRTVAMSPSQGRISPERVDRPASPTKGLGGFVQSAMLKRTDSQSKRFSAQGPPGLSRHGSTASNRGVSPGGISGAGNIPKLDSRPSSLSRGNSMEPTSRPTSSSSNLTITKGFGDFNDIGSKDTFVKPALPHHSRGKSVASTFGDDSKSPDDGPPSPSKRWSPTKSSWLESALNKPDSSKPKVPPPQQPAWMAEISRLKQQRGSVDLGRPADSKVFSSGSPLPSPTKETAPITKFPSRDSAPPQEPVESVIPPPKAKPATFLTTDATPQAASPEEVEKPEPATDPDENKLPLPQPATKPLPIASRFPNTASTAASLNKSKPSTPPKKDFRAALKPRQGPSDGQKKEEPEFLSAVGKLKRTHPEKYVASDPLKDNILRGKAGLAFTGGPKPSARKDELKESLVKQKEAIKIKASEEGLNDRAKASSSVPPPTTPEAIAKRKNLGRPESIMNPPPVKEKRVSTTPEALSRHKSLKGNAKPVSIEKQPQAAPPPQAKEPVKGSKLSDRFNPALAGILARGPSPLAGNTGAPKASSFSETVPTARSTSKEADEPGPELTHMTKGRARGPKRRAPAAKKEEPSTPKATRVASVSLVRSHDILLSNAAPLSTPTTTVESNPLIETPTPSRNSLKPKPLAPAKSPQLDKKIEKPASPELPRKPQSPELERRFSPPIGSKPSESAFGRDFMSSRISTSSKPELFKLPVRPLPTPPEKPLDKAVEKPFAKPMEEAFAQQTIIKPLQISKRGSEKRSPNLDQTREVTAGDDTSESEASRFSVKSATALWGRQSQSSSPELGRSKSPIKLPTKADEQAAMESAGLARAEEQQQTTKQSVVAPKPKPLGLGLGAFSSSVSSRSGRESTPPKALGSHYPASPPLSGGRPQSEPPRKSQTQKKAQSDNVFAEFFDEIPVTTGELPSNIDAQEVLTSSPLDSGKIRTLRKSIKEISGSGQLSPIPMQEEHVLYQESMYLITHSFGDSKGAKVNEVYLWAGNDVADATVEDVQLFARNEAKKYGGKLIVLRQGKETPYFFEALGGIVITRRGSRPGPRQYMLCGRRHLGHIAFDEVELSLKSLCSGFPYLISTSTGAVFLWRGAGCSEEEVSGARLMGMDLGSSGELVEIHEGNETPDFFSAFPATDNTSTTAKGKQAAAVPRSADHWRYKKTSDKYRARLFRVEQQHQGAQGGSGWMTGAGAGLQVSSFFTRMRRPSWQDIKGASSPTSPRPQTPSTPKSPLPPSSPNATTKVVEVAPFVQRDLDPEHVFVLDAFFEIYIIVGSTSRSQSTAFSTALLFAQEYGILAASAEDRPFVPVTTVVLEGVPRDMKAVFRHWNDALVPAAGLMQGKLGRGKSLRLVGLEKALEATRSTR